MPRKKEVMPEKFKREYCWQCKAKLVKKVYEEDREALWLCPNNCGPESLGKLLRLF